MNIEFIKAERTRLDEVKVAYKVDDNILEVIWFCSGKNDQFDLQTSSISENCELASRADDAILTGEDDDNPDLELYLAIRDKFSNMGCVYLIQSTALDLDLGLTDTQLYAYIDLDERGRTLRYNVNFAINDSFIIQYDSISGEFSIPDSAQACWDGDTFQDVAHNSFDAHELASVLGLPKDLKNILALGCDLYGHSAAKELFNLVPVELLDEALPEFAEACYNMNSVSELIDALDGGPDETDMKEWGVTDSMWLECIKKALALKIYQFGDE